MNFDLTYSQEKEIPPFLHGGSEQISQRHAARDLRWLSDQTFLWFASLDEANDVVEDPLIADLDVRPTATAPSRSSVAFDTPLAATGGPAALVANLAIPAKRVVGPQGAR